MSGSMETQLIFENQKKEDSTWREALYTKFLLMAKGCPCRSKSAWTQGQCVIFNDACGDMERCPFVYWGGLR